jgi:NAD(P)-dependent dehydrogenase (short-subunit alcohol dehydrogenase family)
MSSELRGLAGKRVLITGGGKGQGANHARAFAAAGCDADPALAAFLEASQIKF